MAAAVAAAAAPGPGSLRQEGGRRRKRPSTRPPQQTSHRRLPGLAAPRRGDRGGPRGQEAAGARGGGGAAGRGCRFVVRPGPRKQKWEEGGALRPAPSAAHGDGARHIRDPPALAAAARVVRTPAPAAVVTPPRFAVGPAQPSSPARRPAASAAAAASPAAGDMSNPGGRRNGPVKLRLTGEQGGRLRRLWAGRGPGSGSVVALDGNPSVGRPSSGSHWRTT